MANSKEYFGSIFTYAIPTSPYGYAFKTHTQWLYLNGVEYELRESQLSCDKGIEIVIYKPSSKRQRRIVSHYLATCKRRKISEEVI